MDSQVSDATPWIAVVEQLPPEGEVVESKIDDGAGCRNEAKLQLLGRMWFYEGGEMYVYYTPTHWRTVTTRQEQASE